MTKPNKNLGLYFLAIGLIFYIFINVYIVFKIPNPLSTFFVFSWVCLPGIAASLIFYIFDKKGIWEKDE